ncbi:MAG: tetratricopeptide repeat protein [Candidatus Hodarchaeota archaeon]
MPDRFITKLFGRDKASKTDLENIKRLEGQIQNSFSLLQEGDYQKGLQLAEQTFEESQELKFPLLMVQALLAKSNVLLKIGNLDKCLKTVEESENILNAIDHVKKKEISEKKASLYQLKGNVHRKQSEFDLALELLQHSLSIREKQKELPEIACVQNDIGIIHASKGEFKPSLEFLQQSLNKYEQENDDYQIVKVSNNLGLLHAYLGELDRAFEYFQKSLELNEKKENKRSTAALLLNLGLIYMTKGELDLALEYNQNSLTQYQELECKLEVAICLNNIGIINELKGNLSQAIDLYNQSSTIFEEFESRPNIAMSHNNKGNVYLTGGEVNKATSQYELSLKLLEAVGTDLDTSVTLFNMISVWIQRNNIENSKIYLQKLNEINNKVENRVINQIYSLAKALVLKTSDRVVKQAEAQQIFQQITDEKITQNEIKVIAMKNLCELLIHELQTSGQEEVLIEIKGILEQLLSIAQNQHSDSLLVETYLIQSKIALLELDLNSTRQLLSQALQIAEEKGLQGLVVVVSKEYDSLLNQIGKWDDLADKDVSIGERLELAELESMVTRMIRKKADKTELSEEEPILFLILSRSGMSMFSKHFVSESLLPDQLIGGFLTAINAFTQQAFSESGSIEGIKHKDYTILMKPVEPFLCCYVFRGPSYYSLQKLQSFSDTVKVSEIVLDILSEASNIGRDVSEDAIVNEFVSRIFLSSPEIRPETTSEGFFSQKVNITTKHGIYLECL